MTSDQRRFRSFLGRPVPWGALAVVVLALLVGFSIGFVVQQDTSHTATNANRTAIQEIQDRQHALCMTSNDNLDALRAAINASLAPGATTRVAAPPFPEHPDVQAYIQRLLDGLSANGNSTQRDRVLAAVPPNAQCSPDPKR